MNRVLTAAAVALVATLGAAQAQAAELIGSYVAYIGQDDLYNSRGARLSQPWQVMRQDRANYHRFGISQAGDQWDPFFDTPAARGHMERLIMNGSIDPSAARNLLNGGATVFVQIYGQGHTPHYLNVTVAR